MLTILCDNSEKEVAIVTDENAAQLWIYSNGKRYNIDTYRPAFGEGRQLREDKRQTADAMIGQACDALEKLKESKKPVIEYVEKVVEVPTENSRANFADALQAAFLETLTAKAGEQLLEDVLPIASARLESELIDKFGIVPKVTEIKIPERKPWQTTEILHEKFDAILSMLLDGESIYLCGPAGTGKSYIAQQAAKALDLDYYCANAVTDEVQLTGFVDANGRYHETEFFKAFSNGGVFLLDELDASIPDVLVMLNNALANGYFPFPCGRISAHKDFHCIAAGNTFGTGADDVYTGRSVIDAATTDRFAMVFVDYDRRIEVGMANGDNSLVEFAHAYRDAAKKSGINTLLTYRGIKRLAKFVAYMDKAESLKVAVLKGMPKDDLTILCGAIENHKSEWLDALISLSIK